MRAVGGAHHVVWTVGDGSSVHSCGSVVLNATRLTLAIVLASAVLGFGFGVLANDAHACPSFAADPVAALPIPTKVRERVIPC